MRMVLASRAHARSGRQSAVAHSAPDVENYWVQQDQGLDETSVVKGDSVECDDVQWEWGHEQDARAEKERMARMSTTAWCDFCGVPVPGRKSCFGCKKRGVKTYYCDLQCQAAAWRLPPKHRCGR